MPNQFVTPPPARSSYTWSSCSLPGSDPSMPILPIWLHLTSIGFDLTTSGLLTTWPRWTWSPSSSSPALQSGSSSSLPRTLDKHLPVRHFLQLMPTLQCNPVVDQKIYAQAVWSYIFVKNILTGRRLKYQNASSIHIVNFTWTSPPWFSTKPHFPCGVSPFPPLGW